MSVHQALDQRESTARRFIFVSRQAVGGAFGQAQTAFDAAVESKSQRAVGFGAWHIDIMPRTSSACPVWIMSYFSQHVFFCTNLRADGSQSCDQCGSRAARDYVKKRCKELGIHGAGGVRINTAGCLDRCALGPVIVIYPQETWYTYVDNDDLDEIIERHLLRGEVVERLLLPPD